MQVVTETNISEFPLLSRGKVRDIYEIDERSLLIVTTDRMSAFDVVMNEPVPYKGVVLNQLTLFWMEMFQGLVENHLLASRVEEFPEALAPHKNLLEGRAVVVRRAKPLPVECIVRGYITGSGWKDYQRTGMVSGHELPTGLQESQRLERPLFTPSTKAEIGDHDENITLEEAAARLPDGVFEKVRDLSLTIYSRAREYAAQRGILIADTKFEFGLENGSLLLIDEVLTPDSSRFWPAEEYEPGTSQRSFDKQYLRDWLSSLDWDKAPPPPALPEEVVEQTRRKYFEAYEHLTGEKLVT
jgi:phosphoribosylaminoimidazole-succinocarboxamide synthase